MNVGEIDVEGAPSLYLFMSTDPKVLSASNNADTAVGVRGPAKAGEIFQLWT